MAWPVSNDGDLFQLTFVGQFLGQRILNTFGWRLKTTAVDVPTDNIYSWFLADDQYLSLQTAYLACFTNDYDLDAAWFQRLYTQRVRKYVLPINLAGGIDSPVPTVSNIQASIARYGVLARRSDVGGVRMMAPTDAEYVDGGLVQATYATLLNALATKMKTTVTTVQGGVTYDFVPVILHRGAAGAFTSSDVVSTEVMDTVRTMSKRNLRKGI